MVASWAKAGWVHGQPLRSTAARIDRIRRGARPPRRRRADAARPGRTGSPSCPLLVFVALAFGHARRSRMLNGAFTVKDPTTGAARRLGNIDRPRPGRLPHRAARQRQAVRCRRGRARPSSGCCSPRPSSPPAPGAARGGAHRLRACSPTSAACRWPSPSSPPSATPASWLTGLRPRPTAAGACTASGGLALVYLYFLIPLMVLIIVPALDGLRPQWREAAQNTARPTWQYWRHVGAARCSRPRCSAASCCCSAAPSPPTPPPRPWSAARCRWSPCRSPTPSPATCWSARRTSALALSLDMIVVAGLVMAVYLPLQRRSARWLR